MPSSIVVPTLDSVLVPREVSNTDLFLGQIGDVVVMLSKCCAARVSPCSLYRVTAICLRCGADILVPSEVKSFRRYTLTLGNRAEFKRWVSAVIGVDEKFIDIDIEDEI